jgi:hypothetical protein
MKLPLLIKDFVDLAEIVGEEELAAGLAEADLDHQGCLVEGEFVGLAESGPAAPADVVEWTAARSRADLVDKGSVALPQRASAAE